MSLGLIGGIILLLVLLRWSRDPADSPALWLPVIWLFIISTRLPSQWLGITSTATSAAMASEDGSGFDRVIYLTLTALALWILARRRLKWSELFARNSALMLFLVFALASVVWSDYPYVSF